MIRPLLASLVAVSVLLSSAASHADETLRPPSRKRRRRRAGTVTRRSRPTVSLSLSRSPRSIRRPAQRSRGSASVRSRCTASALPSSTFPTATSAKRFLDLGLRIGIPIAFGFIGAELATATAKCSPDLISFGTPSSGTGGCPAGSEPGAGFAPIAFASFGAMLGIGTASILDAAVLAREPAVIAPMNDEQAPLPPPARRDAVVVVDVEASTGVQRAARAWRRRARIRRSDRGLLIRGSTVRSIRFRSNAFRVLGTAIRR